MRIFAEVYVRNENPETVDIPMPCGSRGGCGGLTVRRSELRIRKECECRR